MPYEFGGGGRKSLSCAAAESHVDSDRPPLHVPELSEVRPHCIGTRRPGPGVLMQNAHDRYASRPGGHRRHVTDGWAEAHGGKESTSLHVDHLVGEGRLALRAV